MSIFDNLIIVDKNGKIKYEQWIEWNHISNGKNIIFNSGWMIKPNGKITINTPLAN